MERKLLTFAICFLFIITLGKVFAFNLDTKSAVIYEGPVESDLFGYAVATHSYKGQKWLLVGAPLSNATSSNGEKLVKYGNLFKCEYRPGSNSCSEIVVDNQTPRKEEYQLENGTVIVEVEKKTEQWLGATVQSTGENGRVVTCAPRYTRAPFARSTREVIIDHRYIFLIGRCFRIDRDLNGIQGNAISPCKGGSGSDKGYCQAGFSAEYSADGGRLLISVPGKNLFRGGLATSSIFKKEINFSPDVSLAKDAYMGYAVSSGHFLNQSSTEFIGGAPRGNGIRGKVVMFSLDENSVIQVTSEVPPPPGIAVGSYFGSAICVVDLNNDKFSDLLIGAPRASDKDEGRVFVYVNNKKGALDLQDSLGLVGDDIPYGQFGRAIARVGDLNKDGLQDVAVGAPFEDDGAVYIYHGSNNGINPRYKQKLKSSSVDSGLRLFGSSIAGRVDMDGNGYPDIAVGAYGSNKVVLFRTRSSVNVEGKMQLSRDQIVLESDDNLCLLDDGKYYKCLNLSVCFTNKDKGVADYTGLGITYTVDLDRVKIVSGTNFFRRVFFLDEGTKEKIYTLNGALNLTKQGESQCSPPRTVYVKEKDNLADVASSLTFDLDFGLVESCGSDLCPVLNDSLPGTHSTKAFLMKRCKNQRVCVPDLAVDGNVVLVGYDQNRAFDSQLRIGLVKELLLQLKVSNRANDYAYYSKLVVKYPSSMSYQGTDDCEHDRNSDNETQSQISITCDVGKVALPGLSNKTFSLKFSTTSVEEDISILAATESQDVDANEYDNSKEFFIAVKYEADLEIKGYSKPDQVIYSGAVKSKEKVRKFQEEIGPEIVQTIKVSNRGPSVVDWSQLTITVPKLLDKDDPDSFLMYLLQVEVIGSGSCNAVVNPLKIKSVGVNESVTVLNSRERQRRDVMRLNCGEVGCQSFQCRLGRLRQGDKVEIKLTSRLWQNTLLKLEKPSVVELETIAEVEPPAKVTQPDNGNDSATIVLTAKPERTGAITKSTPWWVYLVSVLGGVILMAGAIFILYKLGFFKRKNKSLVLDPTPEETVPMNKV